MKCPNCGKEIEETTTVCPFCKATISQPSAEQPKEKVEEIKKEPLKEQKPKKKILKPLLISLSLLIILAGIGIFCYFKIFQRPFDIKKVLPKDTIIYSELNLDALENLNKVISKIPTADSFLKKSIYKPYGIELATLKNYIKEKIIVAMIEKNLVISVSLNKPDQIAALVDILGKQTSFSEQRYKGFKYLKGKELSLVKFGNFVVISSEEGITKLIDNKLAKNFQSISSVKSFLELKKELSDYDDKIYVYYNIKKVLTETLSPEALAFTEKDIEAIGFGIEGKEKGVKIKAISWADPVKLKEKDKSFEKIEEFKKVLITSLPKIVALYYESKDLGNSLLDFLARVEEENKMFALSLLQLKETLKKQYGIDLEIDLLRKINGSFALVALPSETFNFNLILDLPSKTEVKNLLEKIKKLSKFEEEETEEGLILSTETLGSTIERFKVVGIKFKLNIGTSKDKLILSLSPDSNALKKLMKKQEETLVDNPIYDEIRKELPEEGTAFGFLHLKGFYSTLESVLGGFIYLGKLGKLPTPKEQAKEVLGIKEKILPYLDAIKAVGFTNNTTENELISESFWLIK